MIVWSGRGFLTALVLIGTLFLSLWALPDSLSDYGFVIACFISAGFSWIFGVKWNKQNERIVTDDKTGQKLRLRSNHSLFWIPMQYYGIIFSIIGIIILFQNSILLSIVALIILVALAMIEFLRNKTMHEMQKKAPSNSAFKSAKTKKQEQLEEEEKLRKQVEEEEEQLRNRKEKEDPSRFMPK